MSLPLLRGPHIPGVPSTGLYGFIPVDEHLRVRGLAHAYAIGDATDHPSIGASCNIDLECLEIAGDPNRVSEWLGTPVEGPLEDVKVDWVGRNGVPGLVAATFNTRGGTVRI